MTMAHSLEGRVPFLTPALVDLAINLPQTERINGKNSKIALRRIARHYLPAEIANRGKHGFVLPMRNWLAEWFEERKSPERYFSVRRFLTSI